MYLVRVIYVSSVADSNDHTALPTIIRQAQANNEAHDLTGLLVFNHRYYLQAIEGSRVAVNRLLANLYRDPRHHNMLIISFDDIDRRVFSDWSMRFVPAASASREVVLRNGVGRDFEPYTMTGASALGFLRDMAELAATA